MKYGQLNQTELETVVGWFLHRVDVEQRAQLMAELPLLYAKLFPSVTVETIVYRVRERIESERTAT